MKGLITLVFTSILAAVWTYSGPEPLAFIEDLPPTPLLSGRITNGARAKAGQFPYQVGLSLIRGRSSHWCGGSLIAPTWILTASHCTVNVTKGRVYLGGIQRTSARMSFIVNSSAIYQHSGYDQDTLVNDISLIRIPTVSYSREISAIKVPSNVSSYSNYSGSYAIASGWGRTSDDSSVSSYLNYARLVIIPNSKCASTFGSKTVSNKTICVSTPGGTSPCKGDSGGPLVLESSDVLVGITSFISKRGCLHGAPTGFVRVTSYLDWIRDKTGIFY